MKKILLSLFALSLLCLPTTVKAADMDMAQLKCSEFLESEETIALLLFWIDGYLSEQSDNTVISNEWMETLGTHMGTFCGTNPNKTIMDAIEALE